MDVRETIRIDRRHSIEIGVASWSDHEIAVRNRYDNARGKFLPRSSSELPLRDVVRVVEAILRRNLLEIGDALTIMDSALASVRHQTNHAVRRPRHTRTTG